VVLGSQANISKEIWPYINPNSDELVLLELPRRPELADFDQNARSYAQLSAAQQRTYENARRYYDQDMKYYSRQQDQLQAARAYITSTVSQTKKSTLDPELTVRQWLEKLAKDTKPPKGYMLTQMKRRYQSTLKSFKSNKLSQWLDEWEATMVECIKYDLPEITNGHWLRDLADLIRPTSDTFFVRLMEDADDDTKSDPEEFRRVARELRERLDRPPKGGRTSRGNAFQTNFGPAESSEEGSDAKNNQGTEQAPPKGKQGRKRTGTDSLGTNVSKKPVPECPACGKRGHSLAECWCIFEELLPEGMKSSAYRVRKAKAKVDEDEQLTTKVQEIRRKMDEEAKKKTK